MAVPTDRKFSNSHEWCKLDGDIASAGITQYAADQLTDITFVELPAVGTAVTAGEPFGEIESVKSAGDLNAPISGEVVETNGALVDNPGLLNEAPFGAGWILRIKLSDPAEMDNLMDGAAYEQMLED